MMKNTQTRNLSGSPLLETDGNNLVITVLLYLVVGVMACLLCLVSFVGVCEVNQSSMLSTLKEGDHVLTAKYPSSIKSGDIVILDAPDYISEDAGKHVLFIKRVVAVGGEAIKFTLLSESGVFPDAPDNKTRIALSRRSKKSEVFILQEESFINEPMLYNALFRNFIFTNGECVIEIEKNTFFVMGDNRNNSNDSRTYGSFAQSSIQGKRFFTLEPGSLLDYFFRFLYKSSSQENRFLHNSSF